MAKPKKTDAQKLAELLGIEAPKENVYETPEDVSREAEAALIYAESPQSFIRKECKICGRTFAHTRGAIAYCSNSCRARGLEAIGIQWHWTRNSEVRWGNYKEGEPLVVPPEAVLLIDQVSDTQEHLKCPVYNHMRDQPEHGAWCWGDTEVPEGIELIPYPDPPANNSVINQLVEDIYAPKIAWEQQRHDELMARLEPEPEPEVAPHSSPDVLDILAELGLE